MLIRDVMNTNPARIAAGRTLREAAEAVRESQCSDLMVVDDAGQFIGVLSEGDLIRHVLPRLDEIVASGGSLAEAREMFVDKGQAAASSAIDAIIIRKPVTVTPNDALLQAASTMVRMQIRRLPVVDGGKLVGTVSRADICVGVLRS
jgi:CBS domain-containing protein